MSTWAQRRKAMVATQIAERGVSDPLVLAAMRSVPRECFVPERSRHEAFDDRPLPIDEGQTISQPYIVALMAEAALGGRPSAGRVLEVGTGCGYSAAVLHEVAAHVVTIERISSLAASACETLADLGLGAIEVRVGDGTMGFAAGAPYDAIVVTAGGPTVPSSLIAQLAIDGRLVAPVGDADAQRLLVVTRTATGTTTEDLGGVRFVPLIGAEGWPD